MSVKSSQIIPVSEGVEIYDLDDRVNINNKTIHKSRSGKESQKSQPVYVKKREFSREKSRSNSRDDNKKNFASHRSETRKYYNTKSTPENSPSRGSKHSYKSENYLQSNGVMTNARDPRLYIYKHSNDEARFFRLISRLEREDEMDRPFATLRQIKEILSQPENFKLARNHNCEIIAAFETFLQNRWHADLLKELVQCIIAFGIALDGDCKGYFEWLFTIARTMNSLEMKLALFNVTLEVLKSDKDSNKMAPFIPMVTSNVQSVLENAESHEVLMATAGILLHVATVQPAVFTAHFRDTVDILVGWHIDSVPSHVAEISQALITLHDFWVLDIAFTVNLMTQFLEDMDSYGEELAAIPSIENSPDEDAEKHQRNVDDCLTKIDGLIRVFSTVLKSLGKEGSPAENPGITWEFIVRAIKGIFKCTSTVIRWTYEESLLTSAHYCATALFTMGQFHAHECAALLFTGAQTQGSKVLPSILSYLSQLAERCPMSVGVAHLLSAVRLMAAAVRELGAHMPPGFLCHLLGPSCLPHRLKASPCPQVVQAVVDLYQAALGLKNVPVLEESYHTLLSDLAGAYACLLGTQADFVTPDPHFSYTCPKQAKLAVLVDLAILTPLATIKHSIIGMWALKPSLFDLLSQHLQPPQLTSLHPDLHFALLRLFYAHCSRHGHFISSSIALQEGTQYPISRPTSGHFCAEVKLLASACGACGLSRDVCLLVVGWARQVMEALQHNTVKLCDKPDFSSLASSLAHHCFSSDEAICQESCKALHALLKYAAPMLPEQLLSRLYQACLLKFSEPENSSCFFSLFTLLPLDIISSHQASWPLVDGPWLTRRLQLAKPPTQLGPGPFKGALTYILQGFQPSGGLRHTLAWEAAQLCVIQKLRTPLGKPQDTFTSIEGAIKNYAKGRRMPRGDEDCLEELRRARLLLDLTCHLEKLMYNAYEGTAVALYNPPKAVRNFFRTNRATCLEWLGRIRMAMIVAALRAGRPATAVQQGWQLLWEISSNPQSAELEPLLVHLTQALIKLSCPEAILGLYIWLRDTLGRKFTWIKAAVDQASGRFEDAAYEYSCVLRALEEQDGCEERFTKKPDSSDPAHLQSFLLHQTMDCYLRLGEVEEALRWSELERESWSPSVGRDSLQYLQALNSFESQQWDGLQQPEAHGWDGLANVEELKVLQLSATTFRGPESTLENVKEIVEGLHGATASLQKALRMGSEEWPPLLDPQQATFFQAASALAAGFTQGKKVVPFQLKSSLSLPATDSGYAVLQHGLLWTSIWQQINDHPTDLQSELQLSVARIARKQHNFRLARRMLLSMGDSGDLPQSLLATLQQRPCMQLAFLHREGAKLLHSCEETGAAVEVLVGSISRLMDTPTLGDATAKALLTLARCLQHHSGNHLQALTPQLQTPLLPLGLPDSELIQGRILHTATSVAPDMAKPWLALATWSYRWGYKAADSPLEVSPNLQAELLAIVKRDLSEGEQKELLEVIGRGGEGPEWLEAEQEPLVAELRCRAVEQAFQLYQIAAKSYFTFLQCGPAGEEDHVTATLRLLRLVVKHAAELRPTLEEGLANTPTGPWRGIIPQLVSRLNHPEPYVRQSISELLCRVAQDSPHLILFPAVVGSLSSGPRATNSTGLLKSYLGEDGGSTPQSEEEEEAEERGRQAAAMQDHLTQLVDTLARRDACTIAQVQVLVSELRRVTVLWDELWLGTLTLHHSDTSRRIQTLEEEMCKVQRNESLNAEEKSQLIADKHYVFVRPLVFLLEQLNTITSQEPETPHEVWFQETFGQLIRETLDAICSPSNPERPQLVWHLYKQLHQRLQQGCGGGSSRSQLVLADISPALAQLRDTQIPMPGCVRPQVTVKALFPHLSVLPTKTKPKKLAMSGSDGRKYTYLFKGLEDLHLDERIMQFLAIVNTMLEKHNRKQGKGIPYRARHYSVTPLGPRSGLIQWVDRATPLFGLYKRWQQREAVARSASAGPVPRPSELYYAKLTPLLKEKGITNLENRKEWPLSVQLQVLKELVEETPRDLLAKELWCSSTSGPEWWNMTQTYSRSTAVLSIVGYIIGLGDRHLDNVLVDLNTGEVIHIDYNVCFEKGKNLRVPEKVPFRMTPNIETALGLTGVEGTFRVSCETVLKVMRRGRETLLTLLEAFVYDPLVEWTTAGGETGFTGAIYGGTGGPMIPRQAMESQVVFRLFGVRLVEMRASWLKSKQEMEDTLEELQIEMENWVRAQAALQTAERELQEVCHQRTLIDEALGNPHHPLYTLPTRYKEFAAVKMALLNCEQAVREKLAECAKWQVSHEEALEAVCGPQLGEWLQQAVPQPLPQTCTISPAVDFLNSSGKPQLVQQCEAAEVELNAALQDLHLAISTCVETLSNYSIIVMQFPASFRKQNRSVSWQQLLSSLLDNFTHAKCLEVEARLPQCGPEPLPMNAVHATFAIYVSLKNLIADTNNKLIAALDFQHHEGLPDLSVAALVTSESRNNLSLFIQEHGPKSLLPSLVKLLVPAARRFLRVDQSVANILKVEQLKLVTMESYLEEVTSMMWCLQQHLGMVQELVPQACQVVVCAHSLLSSLEDLSLHFRTIILPEALKLAQQEEPSGLALMDQLSELASPAQLMALITDLETDLRNLMIEGLPPTFAAVPQVELLRQHFLTLAGGQSIRLTPGQMLLTGFNGLFTKLESDLGALAIALQASPDWKKLDIFQESLLSLPSVLLTPGSRELLSAIMFLRRVQTMQAVFAECRQLAALLSLNVEDFEPNLKLLADIGQHPLEAFLSHYVCKQLLGIPEQAVCIALCCLLETMTGQAVFETSQSSVTLEELLQACPSPAEPVEQLLAVLNSSLEKEESIRRSEQGMQLLKSSLQRKQLQLARFQWLYEDYLTPNHNMISPRTSIMSDMRKHLQNLGALESHVAAAQQRFAGLAASAEQRVKWASGVNPSLAEVRDQLEAAVAAKAASVGHLQALSRDLASTATSILHFEALRTYTSEARTCEANLIALIKRCQVACLQAENCSSAVTTAEEKLLFLLDNPPEQGELSAEAVAALTEKVSLATCKDKLEEHKLQSFAYWDSAKRNVMILRNLLSEHHHMMVDVRNILRTLAKYEEQQGLCGGPVQLFLQQYKALTDQVGGVVREVLGSETDCLETVLVQLPGLVQTAQQVFDRLLQLPSDPRFQALEAKGGSSAGTLPSRDPRTGRVVQERNSYATSVLKRVKHKLEGRDPDPGRKSSIAEQVEFVVKEATNLENLAVLYEGWTPWV